MRELHNIADILNVFRENPNGLDLESLFYHFVDLDNDSPEKIERQKALLSDLFAGILLKSFVQLDIGEDNQVVYTLSYKGEMFLNKLHPEKMD